MAEKSWSESFQDILGGLVTAYGTVETVKAQTALEKAKASWAAFGLPNQYMNPQALGAGYVAMPGDGSVNNLMPVLLVGGVLVVAVLLLSK